MFSFFGVFVFCYFVSLVTLYPGAVAAFHIITTGIVTLIWFGWSYSTTDWINFIIRIVIAIVASYAGFAPAWIHLRSWSKFKMFLLKFFPSMDDLRRVTIYGVVVVIFLTVWTIGYEIATFYIKIAVPGPGFIHSNYQIGLDAIYGVVTLFTLFFGLFTLNPRFWSVNRDGTPIGEENIGAKDLAAYSWVYIIGVVAAFIAFISLTLRLIPSLICPAGEDWPVVLIITAEVWVYALIVIFATKYYSNRWKG